MLIYIASAFHGNLSCEFAGGSGKGCRLPEIHGLLKSVMVPVVGDTP